MLFKLSKFKKIQNKIRIQLISEVQTIMQKLSFYKTPQAIFTILDKILKVKLIKKSPMISSKNKANREAKTLMIMNLVESKTPISLVINSKLTNLKK